MPSRERGTPWYYYVLLAILFLLLLKAFKVLPDLQYIEVVAGVGSAFGVVTGLFYLIKQMFSFQGRLSVVETDLGNIKDDLKEIKAKLDEHGKDLTEIKSKLP